MEQRGEPIAGSHLFRDFCAVCGEPIRVPAEKRGLPRNFCLGCMRKAVHKLAESVQKQDAEKSAPTEIPPQDDDANYAFDAEE
jgi:hypothetical protein